MGRLTAIVLGAAAGGGYPQWNCRCPVCARAWDGDAGARTQCSVAVSADGEHWTILNASPDLRAQIAATPTLQPHPRGGIRGSPICAVVLTGAEVDQVAGLLNLRERQAFDLFGSSATLAALDANPIFRALASDLVSRQPVPLETPFALPGGVEAELFAVPGKVPLYLESDAPDLAGEPGSNVGIEVRCGGARLVFVPGAAAVTSALRERMTGADLVLFDGTVFTDDEMIRTGTGTKTGRRMGHMPIGGSDGSLAALRELSTRRIYLHLNNTNPVWIADSPERQMVKAAGWEVAEDGMELVL